MLSLDELVADVNDLVPLPQAYVRIRELVHDPESSSHQISQVITNDAGLTGRILRIANSAYMGLITKVDTIPRAVTILGLQQVHDLALATTAIEALSKIKITAFDLHAYWRRSIYCAVVARLLGKRCAILKHDRLFVSGLLHEIGHLVLAHKEPRRYTELRVAAIQQRVPMYQIEQEALGFDYAEISTALLNEWGLQRELIDPIKGHNCELARVAPEIRRETAVIHLAAAISRSTQWQSPEDEAVPEFDPTAVEIADLGDDAVFEIMTEADVAIIEAITLLMPSSIKQASKPPPRPATAA
jgi:HD-like signal output (HDOD) protein